jgi:hypothetical protein
MLNGKKSYNFSDKTHSKDGMFSTGLGVVSVGLFLYLAVMSIRSGGTLNAMFGMLGLVDAVIAVTGLVIAIMSFREEDILPFYPRLGVALNGVLLLLLIALFVLGLVFI